MATSTQSSSPSLTWNSAVAGYVAGVTGVVFGHPLDSAKVWLQTNSAGMNKHLSTSASEPNTMARAQQAATPGKPAGIGSSASMSTLAATQSQAATATSAPIERPPTTNKFARRLQTLRALYSGVTGPLFTVGIVQSINFATYDATRRYLHTGDSNYLYHDTLENVAAAGFVSGTALAFVTSPLILIKTQQQITGAGVRQAVRQAFLTNGSLNLSSFFVGFAPHMVSETVGRAFYYATYEGCKRAIIRQKQEAQQQSQSQPSYHLTIPERMMSAGIAGIGCWSVIFPFDALRNRMYHQHVKFDSGKLTTRQMAVRMFQERSLYRGFSITVLRAGPVAAAVLPVYDLVLEHLSNSSL